MHTPTIKSITSLLLVIAVFASLCVVEVVCQVPAITFVTRPGTYANSTEMAVTVDMSTDSSCSGQRNISIICYPSATYEKAVTSYSSLSGNDQIPAQITTFSFSNFTVRLYAKYFFNVTATNKCGNTVSTTKKEIFYCEPKSPTLPTLLSPTNNSIIPAKIKANIFRYTPFNTVDNFGYADCSKVISNSLTLVVATRDTESKLLEFDMVGPTTPEPYTIVNDFYLSVNGEFYRINSTIPFDGYFNHSLPLKWRMNMLSVDSTSAQIFSDSTQWINITVAGSDCRAVDCVKSQGKCNEVTLLCDCFQGFGGSDCSTALNLPAAAIAGIIIGSIAFFAIVVGVTSISIFRYQLRKKRIITLIAPDFNLIRFTPVKMPDFPPEMNEDFDEKMIENFLLADTNMNVIWNVCKNTPVTESDNLCKSLVYALERHKLGLQLIMNLISKEVEESQDDPDSLFRANSNSTKAFKFYSKMVGLPYLFKTIAVLLQGILRDIAEQEGKKDEDENSVKLFKVQYELDPEKMEESSDENINVLMLQLTCQKFLVQILRSSNDCPGEFKQLFAHIKEVIGARYPDYKYKAIGAFIFLRFYNTGITVPETYGLMPTPPKQSARRQLILLSKVLQNLANGVKFGAKESFMTKLNGFIVANQEKLKTFYDKIASKEAPSSGKIAVADNIYKPSLANIYYQLAQVFAEKPELFEYLPPDYKQMLVNSVKKGAVLKRENAEQFDE